MYPSSRRSVVLSLAVILIASAGPVWAQSDAIVQGRVVAAADGSALPGATVTLRAVAGREPRQATTDTAGRFAFAQVVPDQYLVSATISGFEPQELRVMLEPREVRTITLPLHVARLAVNVSVTADLLTLPSTHSPSSTMLTAERVEAMPVFRRMGLPDAIVSLAPGMIRGHDDFVHIRGHEIALNPLINGIAFWENTHAVFSAGLSPEIVDTANVMTGGFPAEYGNRFGGVVDVVTKSGFRMDHRGSATVSAGDQRRRRVAGDIGGRRGSFGYYAFAAMFKSGRFLSPPDRRAIHDTARGGHAFARLDRNGLRMGSVNVILMADGVNAEIPKTPRDVDMRPLANPEQRTRQQTVMLGWTRAWAKTVAQASAYERWSRLHLLPATGPFTAQAALTRDLLTIGAKADVTRLAGRHTVKAGLDAVSLRPREDLSYNYAGYRDLTHVLGLPHIHITNQAIAFSGRDTGSQLSAFAQDNIQLGSRTTADVGVRLDRHALVDTDTHVSPRLNFAFRAGRGSVLHASFNHFFVPSPIEGVLSSSAGLTRSIQEIGDALPALRPTVENQFEVGGSAPWGPLQFALTGYYRATDNPVHTTVWPDSRIYSYASFDRARAYGLETKTDVPGLARYGVTGYVNYALGRVNFYNPVTGGFITEAGHLTATSRFLAPMDQTHTLAAGATYRHAPSGVWAGLTMEYGSGTPVGHGDGDHEHAEGEDSHTDATGGTSATRVPSHVTTGVSLGFDLLKDANRRPRLILRLDVENVANTIDVIARENVFSPAQYSIPRLISVTARVRF